MTPVTSTPETATTPIGAIVGATATGKSATSIALAQEFGGEIVNADAMQLYRGMDIGTAKLTPDERHGIPHHQLDVLEVTEEASLASYQRQARADLQAIIDRGNLPLLVGGSGLYVRAALDALDIPPTDPQVRAAWERRAEDEGTEAIYAVLAQRDPRAAASIEPGNTRRIVRALEVIELTGRPFSASLPTRQFVRPTVMIGLRAPREVLDERVAERVDRMWADGLLDEVHRLETLGLRRGRTASTAIGYAQALGQLDGALTEEQAKDETTRATRRLVRRQESWFRPDPRIRWCDATDPQQGLAEAMDHVRDALRDPRQWGA